MKKFISGVFKLHWIWQLWVGVLMVVNGLLPFLFFPEPVAVITVVGMFVGAIVGLILVEVQGFTKLLGLMHTPWIPVVVLQLIVILKQSPEGHFRQWLLTSIIVSSISLAIDAIDIAKFLEGAKSDLLNKS